MYALNWSASIWSTDWEIRAWIGAVANNFEESVTVFETEVGDVSLFALGDEGGDVGLDDIVEDSPSGAKGLD
jgi:hypothetical protein